MTRITSDRAGPPVPVRGVGVPRQKARAAAYAGLALVALLAPLLALTGPSGARAVAGFVAVLLVPGATVVGFVAPDDLLDELTLSLAASLVIVIAATQITLWTDVWHPAVLVGLTVPCALVLARHARVAWAATDGGRSS